MERLGRHHSQSTFLDSLKVDAIACGMGNLAHESTWSPFLSKPKPPHPLPRIEREDIKANRARQKNKKCFLSLIYTVVFCFCIGFTHRFPESDTPIKGLRPAAVFASPIPQIPSGKGMFFAANLSASAFRALFKVHTNNAPGFVSKSTARKQFLRNFFRPDYTCRQRCRKIRITQATPLFEALLLGRPKI